MFTENEYCYRLFVLFRSGVPVRTTAVGSPSMVRDRRTREFTVVSTAFAKKAVKLFEAVGLFVGCFLNVPVTC